MFLVKIIVDKGLPQRDPIRKVPVLGLYILFSACDYRNISFHTFPGRILFGAKNSGAGMGGRDIATLIPSSVIGV